ncbi:Uncharacterized membrane protein, required for colicin V production [Alteribacillus persepolensis]|uniref:Uncharacterized membrane protein, required for colicin V production n=1 Tax=Alteribacillus persepolensis TaxID=568899 RepID=A0A1G8BP18_9BACI|nr:CvpA family protein [Alteribacillus persepolensis]SDH34350.1 Uncharacterized membrane protein, required for colicin V production [Alteribacillus persepolensis]
MLSLLIIVILLGSFFIGLRRGFILQLIHLVSFFAALFVAFFFYREAAEYLRLWLPHPKVESDGDGVISMMVESFNNEAVYYAGISFFLLFIMTKILLQMIGSMLDFVSRIPVLQMVNRWLGGLLGFVETYVVLVVFLITAALIPIENLQQMLEGSWVANLMIYHTPFLSEWLHSLWTEGV